MPYQELSGDRRVYIEYLTPYSQRNATNQLVIKTALAFSVFTMNYMHGPLTLQTTRQAIAALIGVLGTLSLTSVSLSDNSTFVKKFFSLIMLTWGCHAAIDHEHKTSIHNLIIVGLMTLSGLMGVSLQLSMYGHNAVKESDNDTFLNNFEPFNVIKIYCVFYTAQYEFENRNLNLSKKYFLSLIDQYQHLPSFVELAHIELALEHKDKAWDLFEKASYQGSLEAQIALLRLNPMGDDNRLRNRVLQRWLSRINQQENKESPIQLILKFDEKKAYYRDKIMLIKTVEKKKKKKRVMSKC